MAFLGEQRKKGRTSAHFSLHSFLRSLHKQVQKALWRRYMYRYGSRYPRDFWHNQRRVKRKHYLYLKTNALSRRIFIHTDWFWDRLFIVGLRLSPMKKTTCWIVCTMCTIVFLGKIVRSPKRTFSPKPGGTTVDKSWRQRKLDLHCITYLFYDTTSPD